MENLPKLTVSEITQIIKNTLETSFFGLTIEGEISGFKIAPTGHWYFSLKDENALIGANLWKSYAPRVGFIPKDGDKVIVTGNISVYAPRGSYSINVTSMKKAGIGDILAMLEERKKKYEQLGYFDEIIKKPIPKNPKKIAVITSSSGAALQDILQITKRRAPSMDIIILPALVQGDEAAETIAQRIEDANKFLLADVIIVGRGGGSIEDLLPFSEECVIEAIHKSEIPVISAVGHEVDWAISDFAADLRAPTPSAAAELVCEKTSDKQMKISELSIQILQSMENILERNKQLFRNLKNSIYLLLPTPKIRSFQANIKIQSTTLTSLIDKKMIEYKTKLEKTESLISSLSPESILERGYSIVSGPDGKSIKQIDFLEKNDELSIRFSKGNIKARVSEINK